MSTVKSPSDYKLVSEWLPPRDRRPEAADGFTLPAGTIVVSADNHFSVTEDIFYRRFPDRLKDRAPRIWRQGNINHIGLNGQSFLPDKFFPIALTNEEVPGIHDITARVEQLRLEGIDKEIVFPQIVVLLLCYHDFEIREWAFRAYNEYLAELQQRMPRSFYGVGLVNSWDPAKARESIGEIKSLGLKTFMMPALPGQYPDGSDIIYADDKMEPFWEAAEEAGLPICFHIGERPPRAGRGGDGSLYLFNFAPFRDVVGDFVFGGILDRHPALKIAFAESGINWLPAALQDAEAVVAAHKRLLDWKLQHPPEHYWRTNFYASFMDDDLGLAQLDRIGVDRVMWSVDYPHEEGVFGRGRTMMRKIVEAAGEDGARRILGGNAIDLFKLD